jgi:predicted transcriptional regulator
LDAVQVARLGSPYTLGRAFSAQEKLKWLEMLCLEREVHGALRVGALLATKFVNGKSGEAWPSLNTMARHLGVDRRTVVRAIQKLDTSGYLERRSGKGRAGSNRYRLRFPDQRESGDKIDQATRTFLSVETGLECPTNPKKEPQERTPPADTGDNEGLSFYRIARRCGFADCSSEQWAVSTTWY